MGKNYAEVIRRCGLVPVIALDDPDGIIEGTGLDVNVEIGTENCSFADLFTASEERDMDMRFGGNLEVNQEYATGCIMCLESCPAGITSNAAYQYHLRTL